MHIGAKPKSSETATRKVLSGRVSAGLLSLESGRAGSGSLLSALDIADKSRLQSAAVRAIGPSTSNELQAIDRLFVPTIPLEGRIPVIPQNAAGVRREPAKSEPVA